MPNELTPEQATQIATWVGQRDALLLEISTLKTESENLKLKNKDLAISNTDIEGRVNVLTGRLEELVKTEKIFTDFITFENSGLKSQKTGLETTITGLEKEIGLLKSQKDLLKEAIITLTTLHDNVFQRAGVLGQVVDHVVKVNADNIAQVDIMVDKLKTSVQKVIDVSNKNIDDVDYILEKLPRMFVELKRSSLARPLPVLNPDRK